MVKKLQEVVVCKYDLGGYTKNAVVNLQHFLFTIVVTRINVIASPSE